MEEQGQGGGGALMWALKPLPPSSPHPTRYFHRPADGSEVMYDAVSIMNADILNYCQKESWCKLAFYLLSFFYYLYR